MSDKIKKSELEENTASERPSITPTQLPEKRDVKPVIPEEIKKNFLQVGDVDKAKYYYKDNVDVEAFRDTGEKLIAKKGDPDLAKALVGIAEAKKWKEITVTGSKEFKQQAWLEASSRGIDVKGYKPNEKDQALLEDKINQAKEEKATRTVDHLKPTTSRHDGPPITKTNVDKQPEPELSDLSKKYDFNSKDTASTDKGIDKSKPQVQKEDQSKGNKQSEPASKANEEHREALKHSYENTPKKDALKKYPELESVYKVESAAKNYASKQGFNDHNKEKFVSQVREISLTKVAKGEQIKGTTQKVPSRSPSKSKSAEISR